MRTLMNEGNTEDLQGINKAFKYELQARTSGEKAANACRDCLIKEDNRLSNSKHSNLSFSFGENKIHFAENVLWLSFYFSFEKLNNIE